jgi:hypothetical protein
MFNLLSLANVSACIWESYISTESSAYREIPVLDPEETDITLTQATPLLLCHWVFYEHRLSVCAGLEVEDTVIGVGESSLADRRSQESGMRYYSNHFLWLIM